MPMMYLDLGLAVRRHSPETATEEEADARIRTADPFITSEVLYQLSYVGRTPSLAS
jgi:hypothetical protein